MLEFWECCLPSLSVANDLPRFQGADSYDKNRLPEIFVEFVKYILTFMKSYSIMVLPV